MTTPTLAERLAGIRARWLGPGTILVDSVTVRQAIDDIADMHRLLTRLRAASERGGDGGDDDVVEAAARIIDPDAWEPDGVYLYRQDRARDLARAALSAALSATMGMEE